MKEYMKGLDRSPVRLPYISTVLYRFDIHVSLAPEKLETSVMVLFHWLSEKIVHGHQPLTISHPCSSNFTVAAY